MTSLLQKKCVPGEGGTLPLFKQKVDELLQQVSGWSVSTDGEKISKNFKFKNFKEALAFANKIGDIAEAQGHHPDMFVGWGKVGVVLTTHAIGGLSENDFILAAKIDVIA